MAIFDSLISEVAGKFGLGDKAGGLLAGLLSLITSSDSGGITGFISKFTGAGLGDVVSSWISRGENTALTTDQLSRVLGTDAINSIAEKAGVSTAAAAPALAYMLPKVVDGLTPDSVVPTSLPDTIMSYISGLSGLLGKGVSSVTGAAGDLAGGAAGAVGAGAAAVGAGLAATVDVGWLALSVRRANSSSASRLRVAIADAGISAISTYSTPCRLVKRAAPAVGCRTSG